ncbi:hypothetical protein [Amycolatopsis sp. NPDC021455]|uniref:hypothetical protein n=1 Tax=Amycolatopsis sp. NPDC021455 TaxID=3154901 RepID=UPI0033D1794E
MAAMFAGGLVAAGVVAWHAATQPDLTDVSGTAVASCDLLMTRPLPQVYTLDGEHLDGNPHVEEPLGTGPCRAGFIITGVERQPHYRVTMGRMSAVVDDITAAGSVELVEP